MPPGKGRRYRDRVSGLREAGKSSTAVLALAWEPES